MQNPQALHRINKPLNFRGGVPGKPRDGDVKRSGSSINPITGAKIYMLRGQPGPLHIVGVSLFSPAAGLLELAHRILGKGEFGCVVLPATADLPPNTCLVNDLQLVLPLDGGDQICGEHYVFYTSVDVSSEEFEASYAQLMTAAVPCDAAAGAEPINISKFREMLGVNTDVMPGDKRSYLAVMALEEFMDSSEDDNERLFANFFSMHVRATNMVFEDLLKYGAIASMVAAALSVWTVRDPLLTGPAKEAVQLLADALDFQPFKIPYKAYWDVTLIKFWDNQVSDEVYDAAIRTNAAAYVKDELLKSKIVALARKLFADLETSLVLSYLEAVVEHDGISFKVACGFKSHTAEGISAALTRLTPLQRISFDTYMAGKIPATKAERS